MSMLVFVILTVITMLYYVLDSYNVTVDQFLTEYNQHASELANIAVLASWAYATNITREHANVEQLAVEEESVYGATAYSRAKWFLQQKEKGQLTLSEDLVRQLDKVGSASLEKDDTDALFDVMNTISTTYARAKVTLDSSESAVPLNPNLQQIMGSANSSYDLLQETWIKWRDQVGKKVRPLTPELVRLQNKKAAINGYPDYGALLRGKYESTGFEEEMAHLNRQMRPLYNLVHAYIRHKLQQIYGEEVIPSKGLLPACVLGDMWGRFWTSLYDRVAPYPNSPSVDPTPQMLANNVTVRQMYAMADNFYTSMGLKPLPSTFYEKSMLQRPTDGRDVACHGTAWDFMDGKDFRILMCTEVSFTFLETVHHELGHVQYFMQYAHLPHVYRNGANDGFHEAVGELMGMTLSTVPHLMALGLLPPGSSQHENTINYLLRTALKTVVNIPFHYVNDLWRWQWFRGDIPTTEWNKRYWQMKATFLGVKPPVDRTEEELDIFSIFHVANDFDMIRYFTRTILQFQFGEALCTAAGHQGPLHDCDFSTSREAGDKLAAMLSLGASRPWEDALEQLTGTRQMDARPMLRYFQPLTDWLTNYLEEHNQTVGWENT